MKKLISIVLVYTLLAALFCVMNINGAASEAEYEFIASEEGNNVSSDAVFKVPAGKEVDSLLLNGEAVEEGDGITPWKEGFSSSVKNYIYDSEEGTLTLSHRYIASGIDLFGNRELNFVLNFTDGTSENLTLKGKYNYHKVPESLGVYSGTNVAGYKEEEVFPDKDWAVTASSAYWSYVTGYIDGGSATSHSDYLYEGSGFVFKYELPHYVVIDTGKKTPASGIKYLPRTSNSTGLWLGIVYEGSYDGINFTEIGRYNYAEWPYESVFDFGKNTDYRYYRAKITSSGADFAVGNEIHLVKPKVNAENKSVDVSYPSDISFEMGGYGKAVINAYMDGELIDQGNYKLENGVFSLNVAYVGKLSIGEHALKAVFDDSLLETKITITDNYEYIPAKISIVKSESGVYSDGNGIMRFITAFDKVDGRAEVEYYGTYLVQSSLFDSGLLPYYTCAKVTDGMKAPVVNDTYAADVTNIEAKNFNDSVTAKSFVKIRGEADVIWSEPCVISAVDLNKQLGINPYAKASGGEKIDKSNVKIHGRYIEEGGTLYTSQPASGIEVKFEGTELSLSLDASQEAYIHIFVDDNYELYFDYKDDNRVWINKGESTIKVAENLTQGTHTVKILKANEGKFNKIGWKELYTDGTILDPPAPKEKKIKFIGDSITCGASMLNFPENAKGDADGIKYEDSLLSYAAWIGRNFDADTEVFARSGLSMLECIRWNSYYDKVDPFAGINSVWDHTNFEPDLIVQFNWINEMGLYEQGVSNGVVNREMIVETYVSLLTKLKTDHPNAKIMMVSREGVTTFIDMLNDAITEYGKTNDTSDITVMTYKWEDLINPGHPWPQGQYNIANTLIPQIEKFMKW